ncbi:MAG: M3 family metallopeptidase, partial [Candidatus Cloacimonetes bacterium]|nr:M3 family metallopeptidase [Candidatus Cloacimonadota bacterium]
MIYTKEKLEARKLFFYPEDFDPRNQERLAKAFDELDAIDPKTPGELMSMLYQASELMSIVLQISNNLMFRILQNTTDPSARQELEEFIAQTSSYAENRVLSILAKYYHHPLRNSINQDYFKQINLFLESKFNNARTANEALLLEEYRLIGEYRNRVNQLNFEYEGQSYLFREAKTLLQNPDPIVRHQVWEARATALMKEKDALQQMFSAILALRHQQAKTAGYSAYYDMDYVLELYGNLDVQEVKEVISSTHKHLAPIIKSLYKDWQKALSLKVLAPWDCSNIPEATNLKPFQSSEELVSKAIHILYDMRFEYGILLDKMWNSGMLDLDAKPEKAEGQFYFGDVKHRACKVLMNCTGTQENLSMFFHEMGHVLQMMTLMRNTLYTFTLLPFPVREVASQTLVYLSSRYWEDFYPEKSACKAALRHQFSDDLIQLNDSLLATKFQIDLYDNPSWDAGERDKHYLALYKDFFPCFQN